MTLYRIYVDEVGNHDLAHADDPNQRFFSLTGVILGACRRGALGFVVGALAPQKRAEARTTNGPLRQAARVGLYLARSSTRDG